MLRSRGLLGVALVLLFAGALAITWVRLSPSGDPVRALPVPPGDREIAWFHTATNISTWDRFISGLHHAARNQPTLLIDDSNAFLDQTTAIPEVVISTTQGASRLRIRWYKQSSQVKVSDWVTALSKRDPPPLAILGGGSSDRALELAAEMARCDSWRGPKPLLLITTATANTVYFAGDERRDLMAVYPERTFRFCFTNQQMARAVLDFVWQRPELRPVGPPHAALGMAASAAAGDIWGLLAGLAVRPEFPPEVFALEWKDDPYSVDLSEQFRGEFFDRPDGEAPAWLRHGSVRAAPPQSLPITSSVGAFLKPNPGEARAIGWLLNDAPPLMIRSLPNDPLQRSLLILPSVPQPARRVLAALTGAKPDLGQRLVAVTGDSINFNNVFRDASLIWPIRLAPLPLVFFAHENPVAWDDETPVARKGDRRFTLAPPDGVDDVLHFSQTMSILTDAVFDLRRSAQAPAATASTSDELRERLRRLDPPFFDAAGNRLGGHGEYVLYLRPHQDGGELGARLEVWTTKAGFGWVPVRPPLEVKYR